MGRSLGHHLRKAAFWVGLLPFLLSSLVVAGIMPARADSGTVVFVICTGDGVAEIRLDARSLMPVTDERNGEGDVPNPDACPWAATQPTLAPDPLPAIPGPWLGAARRMQPVGPAVLAIARATGLPPATGPPPSI